MEDISIDELYKGLLEQEAPGGIAYTLIESRWKASQAVRQAEIDMLELMMCSDFMGNTTEWSWAVGDYEELLEEGKP